MKIDSSSIDYLHVDDEDAQEDAEAQAEDEKKLDAKSPLAGVEARLLLLRVSFYTVCIECIESLLNCKRLPKLANPFVKVEVEVRRAEGREGYRA